MRTLHISFWLPVIGLFAIDTAFTQSIRINGSALFAADEIVHAGLDPRDPGSANVIKGGLVQNLGLEYRHKTNTSYELIYFRQQTSVNDYHYLENNNTITTNLNAKFQYLMFSAIKQKGKIGKASPFIGPMAGIAFSSLRNPINGIQQQRSSFAWGIRTGIELGKKNLIKTRFFANALWTVKGIGGNFASNTAPNVLQTRYHTMIQFQTGVSLSLDIKNLLKIKKSPASIKAPTSPAPEKKSESLKKPLQINLVKEMIITGDTLIVSISDDALVDNDTVTLTVNDQVYRQKLLLRMEPEIFKFPIKDLEETTNFIIHAENLGTTPPNTSLLKVKFGEVEEFIQMESTDSSSAMIRFINPQGKSRQPNLNIEQTSEPKAAPEPTIDLLDSTKRIQQLIAVMEVRANEIRNNIPSAIVTQKDADVNILLSSGLMFKKNSTLISESYKKDLTTLYAIYKKFPASKVVIEGYTDDSGPETYNLTLSRNRAKIVFDYLESLGILPSDTETIGHGEKNQKFQNDTEENRQKNRRVEITIKPHR